MLFCIIKLLLHECSGNMKIYSPRKITFSLGIALEKYDISWGEKSSHFPHHHASKCIMAFMQFLKNNNKWILHHYKNGFYINTLSFMRKSQQMDLYHYSVFYAQSLQIDSTSLHKWILHHHHYTLSFMHKSIRMII